jgi:hypothetical protein
MMRLLRIGRKVRCHKVVVENVHPVFFRPTHAWDDQYISAQLKQNAGNIVSLG